MSSTQATATEREQALTHLRRIFPRGATVYGILRHVSRTGRSKEVSILAWWDGVPMGPDEAASIVTGFRLHQRPPKWLQALVVPQGDGIDALDKIAQSLAQALYGDPGALEWEWL